MSGSDLPPVIAIDGPTASGKGTVAARVAALLDWHYLDSGLLYRLAALAALRRGLDLDDRDGVARTAEAMPVAFREGGVWLDGEDVRAELRSEAVSRAASRIAAAPEVRAALLSVQLAFRTPPGLVADGRDMGSVVFPGAVLKVFLTASVQERAARRHRQLLEGGFPAIMDDVLKELALRDHRDMTRDVAPLKHYPDARLLTTDGMTAEAAARQIVEWYRASPRAS
jgi:cytidylate kinase